MLWFRLILALHLSLLIIGCATLGLPPSAPSRAQSLQRMDPALIQADTMGFADRFVSAMTGVYDNLERNAPTAAARDAAHQLKTDLAMGAISNAVNPRPIAGLMDMVVLVTLLRQIADDPWTVQTFGSATSQLVISLRRQETDVRSIASRYLTDAQLEELSELTVRWHGSHPLERALSHVHLADLPEANQPPQVPGKHANSIFGLLFFDPTSNLDPAVREIQLTRAASERMFFYLQRMPLLLQLQTENFYRQALDTPESRQVLSDVSTVAESTKRFVATSEQLTDTIAKFPQQMTKERVQALGQLEMEFERQRNATVQQSTAALRQEQQNFVRNLEAATGRSIKRVFVYLAVVASITAAIVLSAMIRCCRRWRIRASGAANENWQENESSAAVPNARAGRI